jgi:hypothetical protein
MLHLYGFHRVGVAVGDLYFVDPRPGPGQEGAERGVRVEVRLLETPEHEGSIYAARPILVEQPIWRADLLESVAGPPGSHDRTHHHPRMRGWEPGSRQFDPGMSADPLGFLQARLEDLDGLLAGADIDRDAVDDRDAAELRDAAPAIVEAVREMLAAVRGGELARPPDDPEPGFARVGWL